ncbi:helix-turn-helix domain-containing protein [Elusimicrobiota bacterium]
MISVLEKVGWTHNQALVYLACLKLGVSPVSAIRRETKLPKSTVGDALEAVCSKGAAQKLKKLDVRHYKAVSLRELAELVDEKIAELRASAANLRAVRLPNGRRRLTR